MAPRLRPIVCAPDATLGDHRRYPGARLLLTCALCGWAKDYNPGRVVRRMEELKTGGPATPLGQVARRVAWTCPACGNVKWRTDFAWPAGMDDRALKRMANIHRG